MRKKRRVNQMQGKLVKGLVVLVLAGCTLGCRAIEQAAMKDKPYWYDAMGALASPGALDAGANAATIVFERKSAALGAAVPHCVMDGGQGMEPNAVVLERAEVSMDLGDYDLHGWRVVNEEVVSQASTDYFSTKTIRREYEPGNLLAVGDDHFGFLWPGLGKLELKRLADLERAGSGVPSSQRGTTSLSEGALAIMQRVGHERKARIIGQVRSGDTITWTRAPGTMRLEVFTPGGDHGFAAPVEGGGGRTYEVIYHYGSKEVWFEVREPKEAQ